MSQRSLLEMLETELPDLESQVIQEIMIYRKGNRRVSQKTVCQQFSVDKADVKTIFDRMKEEDKKGIDSLDIDMNSSQSSATNEFSSILELKEFLGNSGQGSVSGNANRSQSLIDMLTDDTDLKGDSFQCMGDNDENLDDEGAANVTEGQKLLDHVKWYIDNSAAEISSLRCDQEMFDAEKGNLNEIIHNLRKTVHEKDGKITELTAELNATNAENNGLIDEIRNLQDSIRGKDEKITALTTESKADNAACKTNLCIRCNKQKTMTVAGMNFCSVHCIKQASSDLHGASNLPI